MENAEVMAIYEEIGAKYPEIVRQAFNEAASQSQQPSSDFEIRKRVEIFFATEIQEGKEEGKALIEQINKWEVENQ